MESRIILKQGGYKKLLSYQKSRIVYQVTVLFCNRFLNKRDHTVDQMVQAARSSKQNIVEGCMASATSRETEFRLIAVARSRLEELLEDYHDYLRTHDSPVWHKASTEAVYMRKIGRGMPKSETTIMELARTRKASVVCNMAICLIHQTDYLLERQLQHLENRLLHQGSPAGTDVSGTPPGQMIQVAAQDGADCFLSQSTVGNL